MLLYDCLVTFEYNRQIQSEANDATQNRASKVLIRENSIARNHSRGNHE